MYLWFNALVLSSKNLITDFFHSANYNLFIVFFLYQLSMYSLIPEKDTFLSIMKVHWRRSFHLGPVQNGLGSLLFSISRRSPVSYNMIMILVNIWWIAWEIIGIRKKVINIHFRSYFIKTKSSWSNGFGSGKFIELLIKNVTLLLHVKHGW